MLVLLSVSLIYVACWLAELWYWSAPDFVLLLLVSSANMAYGLVSFRIDYVRWGDRMLWGLSFALLMFSMVHHWYLYMLIVDGRPAYMVFFVVLVVVGTPTAALSGPVRTAILGLRPQNNDELEYI